MQYEKPEITIIEFELGDVITASAVVHTTAAPPTTLPGTTSSSGGVGVGGAGNAQIEVDFSDFFK